MVGLGLVSGGGGCCVGNQEVQRIFKPLAYVCADQQDVQTTLRVAPRLVDIPRETTVTSSELHFQLPDWRIWSGESDKPIGDMFHGY